MNSARLQRPADYPIPLSRYFLGLERNLRTCDCSGDCPWCDSEQGSEPGVSNTIQPVFRGVQVERVERTITNEALGCLLSKTVSQTTRVLSCAHDPDNRFHSMHGGWVSYFRLWKSRITYYYVSHVSNKTYPFTCKTIRITISKFLPTKLGY